MRTAVSASKRLAVFARERAHTILACRNTAAGEEARERLARMEPGGSTEVLPLDLANLESVQGFADDFMRRHDRLDVLVNNAGVGFIPHTRTVDGFERQFATNHLGHFALTGRLFGRLASTPGARVVTAQRAGLPKKTVKLPKKAVKLPKNSPKLPKKPAMLPKKAAVSQIRCLPATASSLTCERDPTLTRAALASLVGVTPGGVKYHLDKLRKTAPGHRALPGRSPQGARGPAGT